MGFGDGGWNCRKCYTHNGFGRQRCVRCGAYNPANGPVPRDGWTRGNLGQWGYGPPATMHQSAPWYQSSPPRRTGRWRGGGGGGGPARGNTPPLDEAVLSLLVDLSPEEWAKQAPKFTKSHVDKVDAARRRKTEASTLGGDVPLPPAVRTLRNKAAQAAQTAAKAQQRAQEAVEAWMAADKRAIEAKEAFEQARNEAAKALATNMLPPTAAPSPLEGAFEKLLAEMGALLGASEAPADGGEGPRDRSALQEIHRRYTAVIQESAAKRQRGPEPQDASMPPASAAAAADAVPAGPAMPEHAGAASSGTGVAAELPARAPPDGGTSSSPSSGAAPGSSSGGTFTAALRLLEARAADDNFRPY
jgi:hypothetical protein